MPQDYSEAARYGTARLPCRDPEAPRETLAWRKILSGAVATPAAPGRRSRA